MKKYIQSLHEIFADEGLDFPVVALLRKKGFTVIYAAEEFVAATDESLLRIATERNCILITKDKILAI